MVMGTSRLVLIAVASAHGSTTEIARAIRDTLVDHGITADLIPASRVTSLEDYDAVILGSAVYTGHWLRPAQDFAVRFRHELATRPVWLFSSGPVGDPAGKMTKAMDIDPPEVTELREVVHLRGHRMFAGKLDPKQLHGFQRAAMLVLGRLRGDFRDWPQIRDWAEQIAADLSAVPGPP